jgi:flagellar hook-basal body complex protein FliE
MIISNDGNTTGWIYGPREVSGDSVRMHATNKAHFGASQEEVPDDEFVTEFSRALRDAFYRVNNLQRGSEELTKQLAVNPDSVDIHDVTIAAEKARLSLMLTKSVVDRITQAYRELINMR